MLIRGLMFPGGREPILQGDGIFLRYPEMSDYAQWAELRGLSRDFLAPWEPVWAADELSRGAFRRRVRRYASEIRNDLAYPFLVFRAGDRVLLGGCTISNVRRGVTQGAAVGYWIGKPHARQGTMFAALRILLPFAFGPLGLHRVEAACIPENQASRNLLRKLGFREEGRALRYLQINGEWRDHLLFGLLQDESPWK
ncbi:MAG TPA: GNAT family protein [Micropepsaceae bacterium]|nr:GNAT family protein [Micropepsaceae bacterium]